MTTPDAENMIMSTHTATARAPLQGFAAMVGLLLSLSAGSTQGVAQREGASGSVTVVLVATLPPGSLGAVVQRRPGGGARDLILLDDASTIADLASALGALRAPERRHVDQANRSLTIAIPKTDPARLRSPAVRRRLQAQLDALHTAAPRHIEGVGTVRAIVVPVKAKGVER